MKSYLSTLSFVIVIAVIVGAGLYLEFDKKLSDTNSQFSNQVNDLKKKLSTVEESANQDNKVAEATDTPAATSATADEATGKTAAAQATTGSTATTGTTATSASTTGWKNFTSTQYTYSLKYPTDWTFKDATAGIPLNIIGFRPKAATVDAFAVSVEKSNIDYTVGLLKKNADLTFKSKTTAKIGDQEFTVLNFETKANTKIKPSTYLIAKDDKVYYFTINASADAATNTTTKSMAETFQLAK